MRIVAAVVLSILFALLTGCPKDDGYIAAWPQNPVEVRDYDETGAAGSLRLKAQEYDAWHLRWHQPYYGGSVNIRFKDDARTEVEAIDGYGDSTIWTGTYLGSQAFRYYVTGDAQARTNVLRMVNTLSGHLRVTGMTGYISRYWAPQDSLGYYGDEWCSKSDRCHKVDTGPHAGDFWWGQTSRDQYTGWFFGMALAYDLVDDEGMRSIIREDIGTVVTTLMKNGWLIIAEDGKLSPVAPQILPSMRLNFCMIGYHVTGDETMKKELSQMLLNANRVNIRVSDINFMNRYTQYYGNNLAHTNWYNLLRLGRVYFGEDDYKWLLSEFNNSVHTYTRLSHNPWFNGIYMGEGGWKDKPDVSYFNQLVHDLLDFNNAPNYEYYLPARDPSTYTLDPVSGMLAKLYDEQPWLEEIMGGVEAQASQAFPVQQQCSAGFMFQKNPFQIQECGAGNPRMVQAGVDYLVAYWLASYHKFVSADM
jgi:hypothetical protein